MIINVYFIKIRFFSRYLSCTNTFCTYSIKAMCHPHSNLVHPKSFISDSLNFRKHCTFRWKILKGIPLSLRLKSRKRDVVSIRKVTFWGKRQRTDVTILPLETFEQILNKRCVRTIFRLHKAEFKSEWHILYFCSLTIAHCIVTYYFLQYCLASQKPLVNSTYVS